jgi:molybdopterin/thiamine biosynthesis adenylyltransferase
MTHPPIADADRYSRQILFRGIGVEGQQRLARAHVAVVGVGAIGAASASLLARAGVRRLTLIDRDIVEPSNLQRQTLFDEVDAAAATPKAEAARAKIAQFNSAIQVEAHITDLVPGNIDALLCETHLLLDCTDNFETRYLLNDYAVQQGKPWIYAGAIGAQAATMTILPAPQQEARHSERSDEPLYFGPISTTSRSPLPSSPTSCLACLFPTPPSGSIETCDTAGIVGAAVNLAASLQTAEALKLLTGQPHLLRRTFLSIDLWTNEHTEVSASIPDPDCEVCRHRRFTHLSGAARPHITLCGRNSVQIHEHHRPVALEELRNRIAAHSDITDLRANALLLRFRRGAHQITVFPDGRALIQGTTDPAIARSLYARFIGT